MGLNFDYYEFMFSKDDGSRGDPLPDYYKGDYRYKQKEQDTYDYDFPDDFTRRNPFEDFTGDKSDITDFGETDDEYPYSVFGLKRSSSDEDMKKAYRDAMLKTHPDKGGDVQEFRMYREAWEWHVMDH
tara:strand:- start:1074 stop:1457 length:384 start_codon:yes stop_codon:yes gene_type:complete